MFVPNESYRAAALMLEEIFSHRVGCSDTRCRACDVAHSFWFTRVGFERVVDRNTFCNSSLRGACDGRRSGE